MSTKEKHLYYLSELKGYKVNKKDQDIRGWAVKDLDNRTIGKVDNLFVNKDFGKVVYVDVEVDQSIIDKKHDPYHPNSNSEVKEFINKEGETHIIIPIGLVDLNLENHYVYTQTINYQTFAETKRYRPGTYISRDYEHNVLNSYERNYPNKEAEVNRTRSVYSDAEVDERDFRRKENTSSNKSQDKLDETIHREKENLRYKSEDRSKPIDDHNRASHHQKVQNDLQPERTLDEDNNWVRDNRENDNKDPHVDRQQRKRNDEDFYDRREFRERDKH